MDLNLLFALIRRWLGRERALARCVVRNRNHVLPTLLALFALAQSASASVLTQGDVTPADNPFTTGINEGLPSDGNFINPFAVDGSGNPLPNAQLNWEGILNNTGTSNVNIAEIVVGKTAFGSLVISGESALNDQTLTVGGSGLRSGGGTPVAGSGIVRITGAGSVYNNDPSIIPPGLVAAGLTQATISPVPRPVLGADGQGNDLYIGVSGVAATLVSGAAGNGTMEISAGGRAEIQDAVVLGRDIGSLGTLIVDGIDSYLGSGGFNGQSATGQLHSMAIGLQGVGTMSVSNGATVQTTASPSFAAGSANVAASIGDAPFIFDSQQLTPGGSGTATVDGASTKWVVAGTLQVGGFTDVRAGGGVTGITDTDADGINSALFYSSRVGQGTLNVQNGALVNIVLQPGIDPTQNPPLYLAVGENGRVNLSGGTINIGEVDSTGQNSRGDRSQIVNDGILQGTGTIITGVFRNRYLGRVIVSSGQSMTIYATSNLPTTLPATAFRPWNNWGSIQVLGNEQAPAIIDFERQSIPSTQNAPAPFFNWSVAPTAPGNPSKDGIISCASCVLRFGSGNAGNPFDPTNPVVGLRNFGVLAFNSGTNYVTGNVLNMPASAALNTVAGRVLFSNQTGTTVTFENDFFNLAGPTVPNATAINILARHSFGTNGLTVNIDTQHPNPINANGDLYLTGNLNVTLANVAPGSLYLGATIPLILYQGTLGTLDVSNPDNPTVDLTKPGHFTGSNLNTISLVPYGLPATDILDVLYGTNSVSLIVKAIGSAMGSDFNGDGIVNSLDLAIWQTHVGTTSGASVLDGDANGDGRVDGADFLIWQRHVGGAPGAGSGSSLQNAPGAVPEPTSVALLAMCGMAFLPIRRRKAG